LWPTDHPRMPDKDSRWMADRHVTVCMPRVTLSIGVGWLKMELEDGQTVGGASKLVCLEWRASKRAQLDCPAVEDPKLEQSRVMDTRSIRRLEYVRMVYFWTVTP